MEYARTKLEEGSFKINTINGEEERTEYKIDDERTVEELLAEEPKLKFEIVFTSTPSWLAYKKFNKCDSRMSQMSLQGDKDKTRDGVGLLNCLDKFRKSEKLEQDNTWYCSKCKSHV